MYEPLRGKKLLVISSDINDMTFVTAAKEMGLYTICCDRYSDWDISPAKKEADEAWDIDYTHTDEIVKKCREAEIDGVIAGYSEERVSAAARISKALGTNFYASEEQIQFTRNKNLFKKKCRENGVLVPHDYCLHDKEISLESISFPVIVKPSDNGGRKGISICYIPEELDKALDLAMEFSKDKKVVVEEYIQGTELCAIYTMKDGIYSLSCLNDKYVSEDANGVMLCDAVISPSKYYTRYINEVDSGIQSLLKDMGIGNGVANFQFIVNESGIYAFEMGYRINGNDDFKAVCRYNDLDFLKMMICYSLTGDMGDNLEKDNPLFPKYVCTVCGYLNHGRISKIDVGDLENTAGIFDVFFLKGVGSIIQSGQTNAQKAFMIKFDAETLTEMVNTIIKIQKSVSVRDENDHNMLMKRFDVDRLQKGSTTYAELTPCKRSSKYLGE